MDAAARESWGHRFADRCHVSDSARSVIRYTRSRLAEHVRRDRSKRAERHELFRAVIAAHEENRALVRHFRF